MFTWSGGPRSSGVGFFCFVSPRAWKQNKTNPTRPGSPTPCKQALLRHFWTRTTITIDKCFTRRGHVVKPWERNKVLFKFLRSCAEWNCRRVPRRSWVTFLYYITPYVNSANCPGRIYILLSSRKKNFIDRHWMGFTLRGTDQQLHRRHAGKCKVRQTWVLLGRYKTQVTGHRSGHRAQVTGHRSQGIGHRAQGTGHRKRSENS